MTFSSSRKVLIPSRKWGEHVKTVARMNAIPDPVRGMTCFVGDDDELYVYDGSTWEKLPSGGGSAPTSIEEELSATEDDFNPTGFGDAKFVKLKAGTYGNSGYGITSMAAGTDWEEKILINIGLGYIFFPMDHPDGTAANRFTGSSGDFLLLGGDSVKVVYDPDSERWRFVGDLSSAFNSASSVSYKWEVGSSVAGDLANWVFLSGSGGSTAVTYANYGNPSYVQLITGGSSSYSILYCAKQVLHPFTDGAGHMVFECVVRAASTSSSSQRFTHAIQLTRSPDSTSLEPNNTIGLRYSDNHHSGNWDFFSIDDSGTETSVDTGVAHNSSNFIRARIEVNKGFGEARCYINGVFKGRITTNLPDESPYVKFGARAINHKETGSSGNYFRVATMRAYQVTNK